MQTPRRAHAPWEHSSWREQGPLEQRRPVKQEGPGDDHHRSGEQDAIDKVEHATRGAERGRGVLDADPALGRALEEVARLRSEVQSGVTRLQGGGCNKTDYRNPAIEYCNQKGRSFDQSHGIATKR